MNYLNEFEWGHELAGENPELELENYAGKIWEIAKKVHQAPQATTLKKNYIAAAKAYGKKLVPATAGGIGTPGSLGSFGSMTSAGSPSGGMHRHHHGRRIHFYRKVIRNAANYLNKALLAGHRSHPGHMVKQAFNRASKMVAAQTGTPTSAAPRFANTAAAPITAGPYQQTPARGTYGTSYTSGPAPAATGMAMHPAAAGLSNYPAAKKRGKLWNGGGAFHSGTPSRSSSSQKQGRWTKKGNTLILHGLSKNIAYS